MNNTQHPHPLAHAVIAVAATETAVGLVCIAHDHPTAVPVGAALGGIVLALVAGCACIAAAGTAARIAVETAWYRHHTRPLREQHPLHTTATSTPRRALALAVAVADDGQLPALDPVAVARETAAFDAYAAGDDSILIEPPFGRWLRTGTPGRHVAAGPAADALLCGYWVDPADADWRVAA